MKSWHLWREDKAEVARQLAEGSELEGHNSAFGDNDLIIGGSLGIHQRAKAGMPGRDDLRGRRMRSLSTAGMRFDPKSVEIRRA